MKYFSGEGDHLPLPTSHPAKSADSRAWKSVMGSSSLYLLFFLLFSLQRLTMGYFSRMKTPGKEFGWKQAEHWITTCWEMGYAVDLSLIFHHCLPRPSIEANMIMLQRKGEIGKIHFDFRALFNSFDVMYFVKSVQVSDRKYQQSKFLKLHRVIKAAWGYDFKLFRHAVVGPW